MCKWQIIIHDVPNHLLRSQENLSLGGSVPPPTPHWSAAVAASEGQGPTLARPPQVRVCAHAQDQPGPACLVRMSWIKDQHSQH